MASSSSLMTISSGAVEVFPCSLFSHLLSSAVRKDRESEVDAAAVAAGEGEAVAGVRLFVVLQLRRAGQESTVEPATVKPTCSTSSSDTGVRQEVVDDDEDEDEEEEQDAVDSGASSQLSKGKVLRDEAGTKPTLCSPTAAARRLRLDLCESSGRPGDPPPTATGLKCSSVKRVRLLRFPSCGLGVSGTIIERSWYRTSLGSRRQPRFRPPGLSGSDELPPNGSSMAFPGTVYTPGSQLVNVKHLRSKLMLS